MKQRARIARVRRVQHGLAASSAAAAGAQLRNLEMSRERLAQMRGALAAGAGLTDGSSLASAGELAMRLDAARLGLTPTIAAAQDTVAAKEQARLRARREQESAERLEQAAARAAAASAERRMGKGGRPRGALDNDEVQT